MLIKTYFNWIVKPEKLLNKNNKKSMMIFYKHKIYFNKIPNIKKLLKETFRLL